MSNSLIPSQFFEGLGRNHAGEEIFDHIPDIVFFIKDCEGRYVCGNKTLAERCGMEDKESLVGLTAREVFPAPLGDTYTEQDLQIIRDGKSIHGKLELHLYVNAGQGWCLTWKEPIIDANGKVAGVAGISRDIRSTTEVQRDLEPVADVLQYVRDHLDDPLRVSDLSERAGLSTYQLDQRIRALFGLSAGQYVTRCRINAACHLLSRTDQAISMIALDCGYGDQSSFTRQFRQSVGIPPNAYRERMRMRR